MIILVIGTILGFAAGWFLPWQFPAGAAPYAAVGILMCLDSLLGGAKSYMQGKFRAGWFFSFSGLAGNILVGLLFTYMGDKLGLPLYLVPVLVSGARIFNNFAELRRLLFKKFS